MLDGVGVLLPLSEICSMPRNSDLRVVAVDVWCEQHRTRKPIMSSQSFTNASRYPARQITRLSSMTVLLGRPVTRFSFPPGKLTNSPMKSSPLQI